MGKGCAEALPPSMLHLYQDELLVPKDRVRGKQGVIKFFRVTKQEE